MLAYIQNDLPVEQTFKACKFMIQLENNLEQMKFDMVPINTNISDVQESISEIDGLRL